jgi:hypothetical protein
MSRPLIQKRIDELEAMFEAGHSDTDVLAALERELAFRSVARSAALSAKVRRALAGDKVIPTPTQNVLFEHQSPPAVQVPLLETTAKRIPVQQEEVLPTLSLDDAYKALRLTSSASWEAIEASRRGLVDGARPDKIAGLMEARRVSIEREAKLANEAYLTLANARVRSVT